MRWYRRHERDSLHSFAEEVFRPSPLERKRDALNKAQWEHEMGKLSFSESPLHPEPAYFVDGRAFTHSHL